MLEEEIQLEPGQIWVAGGEAILVVGHEECGCAFLRAIALTDGARQYSLLAFRDQELGQFLLECGFQYTGVLAQWPGSDVVSLQRAEIKKKLKKKKARRGKT